MFYPVIHHMPVLIHDKNQMYITSDCFLHMNFICEDESMEVESANMAVTTTASAFATCKIDPMDMWSTMGISI
jgi:hypothetical protein